MKYCIIIFLLFYSVITQAQISADSLAGKYLNELKIDIDSNNYEEAIKVINKMAGLRTTLPDEVAYYYGLSYYSLGNFEKAKSGLDKYFTLTGDSGQYFQQAKELSVRVDCKLKGYYESQENCALCNGTGETEVKCVYCSGGGKQYCPLCKGAGVVVMGGSFGDKYTTCSHCKGMGIIVCEHCHGTLKTKEICPLCKGSKKVKVRMYCK